jgi:hypothetical protein
MEKHAERHKCQRSAPVVREKPRVDWKMDLQNCGTGRESRKRPVLVVARNHMGNPSLYFISHPSMSQPEGFDKLVPYGIVI